MSARLRHVVLIVGDLGPVAQAFADQLGLHGRTNDNEGMAAHSTTNEVLKVGDAFVEVVAPFSVTDDTVSGRSVRDRGDGGHALVVEVPSLGFVRAQADEAGVVVVNEHRYRQALTSHLHPKRLGTLVEATEVDPGTGWHYPELVDAGADDESTKIASVDVAVADPAATVRAWSTLFDVPTGADESSVTLDDDVVVRFVGADARGIRAIEVVTSDTDRAGTTTTIGGLEVRFLPD
jgi:hypothetical protein